MQEQTPQIEHVAQNRAMPKKQIPQKVKYETHGDYVCRTESAVYMLTMDDGSHVQSVQPGAVADEIIHCACKVDELSDPCEGFDLRITTAYGSVYLYRKCDFDAPQSDHAS